MNRSLTRREFQQLCTLAGGMTLLPSGLMSCAHNPRRLTEIDPKYDIFHHTKPVRHLKRFQISNLSQMVNWDDQRVHWLLDTVATIFQGLVNRSEPRIYFEYGGMNTPWLEKFREEGFQFQVDEVQDFTELLQLYAKELDGYIVFDPDLIDTVNIAQTWASLDNYLVVFPNLEPLARDLGLQKKEDLRGRWGDKFEAYEWAFDNLLPHCSKHILGAQCVHLPYHPSGDSTIRDFLVCNKAFTFDLSAAFRQRREYRMFSRICAGMEFPAGVWGWHCARDHEHWAVARASRDGLYTLCALGTQNLTVQSGFIPKDKSIPVQKPSPRKSLKAEKNKVYIAFMMTDGDSLWVMNSLQLRNWASEKRGTVPMTWGFLPLLADIAPAMFAYYVKHMLPQDCMIAGPTGSGYTYPHLHPDPRLFLRYSKHYMQRCGLEIVNITNWNDDTNWQEVDLPEFNPLLFKEMDNCIGYVRGMGESAFEPHYNFNDKPYIFCGEGIHSPDKDDVATIRNFIEANPNRPLFIYCLINISVRLERIEKIVRDLKEYDIEYVRLDDFMMLVKDAYKQGLITEDLYPHVEGNQRILAAEAPAQWMGTKNRIEELIPALQAGSLSEAIQAINHDDLDLALGERITEDDFADVLGFALCECMFALVKNTLNLKGVYVNRKQKSVDDFMRQLGDFEGAKAVPALWKIWQEWDKNPPQWPQIAQIGNDLVKLTRRVDTFFAQNT